MSHLVYFLFEVISVISLSPTEHCQSHNLRCCSMGLVCRKCRWKPTRSTVSCHARVFMSLVTGMDDVLFGSTDFLGLEVDGPN